MIAPAWFRPWMVWSAVVAALLLAFAWQHSVLSDERVAHAKTQRDHETYKADQERSTRLAVEDARAEEQRRTTAVQEIADETEAKLEVARADAADARDAGERLRQRVAQLTTALGRASTGQSAASNSGAPAETTADLLGRVQQRLDEAADTIAEFADQSHARGLACERSYDALTPPARSGLGLKR